MIIVEMKRHFQLRAIEWWSAGAMASWGLMVLFVPNMFARASTMQVMLEHAPQHIWGLAAFIAGSVRLCALFVNGLWYRTPAVRWLTAMISIFIWFCIAAALGSSPIANTGIVVYGWHIFADMYSAYRSATDFIESEAQRRLKDLRDQTLESSPVFGDASNVHNISSR